MVNFFNESSSKKSGFDYVSCSNDPFEVENDPSLKEKFFINTNDLAQKKINLIGEKLAEEYSRKTGKNILGNREYEPIRFEFNQFGGEEEKKGLEETLRTIDSIVENAKKNNQDLGSLVTVLDVDSQGNVTRKNLDPSKFKSNPFTESEYQRFYNATYNALQDLAETHKERNALQKEADAGELLNDPPRFKLITRSPDSDKEKKTEGKKEQQKAQILHSESEKQDIETVATAKAQQRKHYQKMLEEFEFLLHLIHTSSFNRKAAEKLQVLKRSIKQVGSVNKTV